MSRYQEMHDAIFAEEATQEFDSYAMACMIHVAVWTTILWFAIEIAASFVGAIQ